MNVQDAAAQVQAQNGGLTAEQLWPAVTEVGAYERHFNEIQAKYRALASTWLLATFGAVGFVLSQDKLDLPMDRLVAAGLLGAAGAIGIVLLWNLDLLVYHRLLDAIFVAALKLEDDYRDLPRLRTNMVLSLDSEGVLPRVIWFYMAGVGVLLAMGTAFLGVAAWDEDTGLGIATVAAGVLVTLLGPWRMHSVTCAPNKFVAEAAERAKAAHSESL